MRLRLILVSACLWLAACGGGGEGVPGGVSAPAPGAPVAATQTANPIPAATTAVAPVASAATLDAYLAALNRHDVDAAERMLAADVVMFDSLIGNLSTGRAAARSNVLDMYQRALPDGQWTLRGAPVVAADGFSYEWALTGTNLGNWTSYLRGRGQKIKFKGITIVRLAGGKISYQANYFDTNALGAQAGW